jgi:hypothetical protein
LRPKVFAHHRFHPLLCPAASDDGAPSADSILTGTRFEVIRLELMNRIAERRFTKAAPPEHYRNLDPTIMPSPHPAPEFIAITTRALGSRRAFRRDRCFAQ